jgi:transposase
MNRAQQNMKRKPRASEHAEQCTNIPGTCRCFDICQDTFYRWKKDYAELGEEGLINREPCHKKPALRMPPKIEEKVICLRRKYQLGQVRISWYLRRRHGMKISSAGVYCFLKRNALKRLPRMSQVRMYYLDRI